MKRLNPRAVWLFMVPSLYNTGIILAVLGVITFSVPTENLKFFLSLGYSNWLFGIIILLIIASYVWARLSYNSYGYELKENGFHKESGIIYKKSVIIPYDRIQNIDIYRSLLARLLGLSDVQIQTAGAAAQVSPYISLTGGAEGRLPGLSKNDAEALRDELIGRTRHLKNQGL